MKFKFTRTTVVVGAFALAAGGLIAVAGSASADVVGQSSITALETGQGKLILSPASGDATTQPTWSTSDACPTGHQTFAALAILDADGGENQISPSYHALDGLSAPLSNKALLGTLKGQVDGSIFAANPVYPNTFELAVGCGSNGTSADEYVQDTFVHFDTSGNWKSGATEAIAEGAGPKASPAVAITAPTSGTTLTTAGQATTYTATVTNGAATIGGTVQFEDITSGTPANIGTAQPLTSVGGVETATLTGDTSLVAGGTHNIVAVYSGDTLNNSETSPQINVLVPSTTGQNITVDIPAFAGTFTYSFANTTVDLGTATHSGNNFVASGNINPVTVHDARPQTTPGWVVSGAMGSFSGPSGATELGNTLGWAPSIGSQDPQGGTINKGATVAPNAPGIGGSVAPNAANPGYDEVVTGGAELADAAHPNGQGNTVLDAALSLAFPDSAPQGHYSGTLTLTAMTSH